jgi:hypothetical protein
VADDAPTLQALLDEWAAETAHSHYEPLPPPARPQAGHARNTGKLQFAPPPIVREIGVMERLEPELQTLRGRVEQAELTFYERQLQLEEQHRLKMEEAERALSRRHDIELAHASLRNVSTNPAPDFQMPHPEIMANMSQREWEQFVADYRNNRK